MSTIFPVITVDGPSGVGKGTVSTKIARTLNWHFLDSGILYRAFVLHSDEKKCSLNSFTEIEQIAKELSVEFIWDPKTESYLVYKKHQDITNVLRSEEISQKASCVASNPLVRQVLVESQRAFRKSPGLVADGRDMGTVIFPDAILKFYLTAICSVRAMRRYKQLKETSLNVNLTELEKSIEERDLRDMRRQVAPLKAAEDAIFVDTTHKTVQEVYLEMMNFIHIRLDAKSRIGKHL